MNFDKIKISKIIFSKRSHEPITLNELNNIKFEDDDIFEFKYVPPVYTNEYGEEGYFLVEVFRMVEETNREFLNRIKNK